jgi:hypothetical protein
MPKKPSESRPVFPGSLAEDLLRVAKKRERPETDLSPLLQALAREWIDQGSFRGREEELAVITARLSAVESQLRALTEALVDAPSSSVAPHIRRETPTLDNLARHVLQYLRMIANDDGVTPQVTAKEIAKHISGSEDKPTVKQVLGRVDKLIVLGKITIEVESGGRDGRRYRVESSPVATSH